MSAAVNTTFVPSEFGFAFSNNDMVGMPVQILGVTVADVIGGLCGGMCVASRTNWEHGTRPIELICSPQTLRTIQLAQVTSFRIPWAPLRYLRLQQRTATRSRVSSTLGGAMPALRRSLGDGVPLLLGLVCALGRSPRLLSLHHVVLAYGLEQSAESGPATVTVHIYDPNYPRDDRMTLTISADGSVRHSRGRSVYAALPLG